MTERPTTNFSGRRGFFLGGAAAPRSDERGAIDLGHAADAPVVFAQSAGVAFRYLACEPPYTEGIAVLAAADSPVRSVPTSRAARSRSAAAGTRSTCSCGRSPGPVWAGRASSRSTSPTPRARAAFQSGRVDAVGLWDPFLAAAELTGQPRVLRDGKGCPTPDLLRRGAGVPGARGRDAEARLRRAAPVAGMAQDHPDEVAKLLAPQLGVPAPVLRLATGRRRYGVIPIDDGIVAEQQRMAEVFLGLGLIPRGIKVREAVATVALA